MNKLTLVLLLALLLSSAAWAQTATYASPVKIMNTPVPVTSTVSGAVTVTPSGGAMPVSGSVAVTGTPTVKIDPSSNIVGSAVPVVFTRSGGGTIIPVGELHGYQEVSVPSSADLVEIESVSGACTVPTGGKLTKVFLHVFDPDSFAGQSNHMMLAFDQGPVSGGDRYAFERSTKIYVKPGTIVEFHAERTPASSSFGNCSFVIQGRVY